MALKDRWQSFLDGLLIAWWALLELGAWAVERVRRLWT